MKATAKDLVAFHRVCDTLKVLSSRGLKIYLAGDTLCLMSGDSHDRHGRPQQENVITSHIIPGAGGGDW